MQETMTTFEAFRTALGSRPDLDVKARADAAARQAVLTKPPGSLGRLEDLVLWLAEVQGRAMPRLETVRALIFAANHGVAAQGVSAFPAAVTAQMVQNFEAGGAAINQLCRAAGIDLRVVTLDLDRPTADFTLGPAMSEAETCAAIATGREAAQAEADLLVVGEMGIGNTTAAAALSAALIGGDGEIWAGPGTGLDRSGVARKAAVIDRALTCHRGVADPLEVLRRLGGREIAALVGALAGARLNRTPLLLDGFVTGAAAAVLHRLDPDLLRHVGAAHLSAEPAHRRQLDALGLDPLLHLEMRLGEASGAALAVQICRAALACHQGMATFAEAGISNGG